MVGINFVALAGARQEFLMVQVATRCGCNPNHIRRRLSFGALAPFHMHQLQTLLTSLVSQQTGCFYASPSLAGPGSLVDDVDFANFIQCPRVKLCLTHHSTAKNAVLPRWIHTSQPSLPDKI
jgi:hypothetical protein